MERAVRAVVRGCENEMKVGRLNLAELESVVRHVCCEIQM